jgi:hypothetical protein
MRRMTRLRLAFPRAHRPVLMPALWAATGEPALPQRARDPRVPTDVASVPRGLDAAVAIPPIAPVVGRTVAAHRAGISPASPIPVIG